MKKASSVADQIIETFKLISDLEWRLIEARGQARQQQRELEQYLKNSDIINHPKQ